MTTKNAVKHPTPNDQRSTVKNPTSPLYAQDVRNTQQQLSNPPPSRPSGKK